ncbi:MAG TPA: carbon monoxide dehydrogenase subunit G [Thermoanaerobaculia bacterium]|nr:carbon monoxide dehydrogenase subunit G [Thermoanaerobaculia bacterium]
MNFKGTVKINAPREKVWRFLTDPTQLSDCAPGLEKLEIIKPNEQFRATASVGFGAVKATFVIDATWMGLDPPNRAKMKIHGKAPGSGVEGTSEMVLHDGDKPGVTILDWSSDVTVVGAIASLAARLMGPVTQKLTDAFFENVRKKIEG